MIAPATIEAIRAATDLAQLAREYGLQLRPQIGGYLALCPVHSENTPSFRIHTKGERAHRFHCFGCGVDGDVVTFAAMMNGYTLPRDYARAVEYLADRAGISVVTGRQSRVQRAVDIEDREMSVWWWATHWNAVRASLDAEFSDLLSDTGDLDFAACCGRLLRAIENMPVADRLQEFRCYVTTVERSAWCREMAERREFVAALGTLASTHLEDVVTVLGRRAQGYVAPPIGRRAAALPDAAAAHSDQMPLWGAA